MSQTSCVDLIKAGKVFVETLNEEISTRQLKLAGDSASEMWQAAYSTRPMVNAGCPIRQNVGGGLLGLGMAAGSNHDAYRVVNTCGLVPSKAARVRKAP